jgi:serine/threonine protein kinase
MPFVKEPNTEPIAGYRLVESLGRGGFGEVWKCEAPGGLIKAIKFVRGDLHAALDAEGLPVEQEWKALQLVKTIRHPFLLGIDRLELLGGELIVVMELADRSLADAFRECLDAGLVGIPRAELLSYLREAAEALDVINLQHHLQHLDVKPANLFLVNRHVKLGDFGLLSRLCDAKEPAPDARLAGLTPLYCSPETLTGVVSGRSDQYSLAVVYQELLTGRRPYAGRNARELMIRRATSEPDLSPLPEGDQSVVARALARDPAARYPSCTEFVRALAPELMPVNSSPFLEGLLTEGTAAPLARARSGTRPALTRGTLPLPRDLDSPPPRRPASRRPPEPLPAGPDFAGYRLVKCLARGRLCETWKAQAPDGRARLVKFPNGLSDGSDPTETEVLSFLSARQHPSLQPVEVLRSGRRVALVCESTEGTLFDRSQHCQTVGLPGVPRRELLDHLHTAAAGLDVLYRDHGLQHLCLTPRSLVLNGPRLLIADMGLGQLLWLPAGHPLGQLNGRYSAPELCAGEVSPACDQYSLAVIYQELLTGTSPFRGGPARGGKTRPNLDLLPAHDREPIARALNPDPERRFPTCADLLDALERGASAAGAPRPSILLPPVIPVPQSSVPAAAAPLAPPVALIGEMFQQAAGAFRVVKSGAFGYFLDPGRKLIHGCAAPLSAPLARLKLAGFEHQWGAKVILCDDSQIVLELPLPGSLWQRCLGRQPALEVRINLGGPRRTTEAFTAIRIEVGPRGCGPEQAVAALEQFGPHLLHDLRTYLQVQPERRARPRMPFDERLGLFPVLDGQRHGDGMACQGKDLSPGGFAVFAPQAPPSGHLYVQSLLTPQLVRVALLGRVVRVLSHEDGRFEIAAAFAEQSDTFNATPTPVRTVPVRP